MLSLAFSWAPRALAVGLVLCASRGLLACGGAVIEPPSQSQSQSPSVPEPTLSPEAARVCALWSRLSARASVPSSGGAQCSIAGTTSSLSGEALETVNFFRTMARLPTLPETVSARTSAQSCAVLMQANGRIDHAPTSAWQCYSAAAAAVARQSLLVGSSGYAMTPYRAAWNWITEARDLSANLGHRRWLLSRSLAGVSYGQSASFACLYLADMGAATQRAGWVAWPPPGSVPHDLVPLVWSVSTAGLGVGAATRVRVWVDGREQSVATRREPVMADDDTVSFVPPVLEAGHRYRVRVEGLSASAPIDYEVATELCPAG